jgi:hypothetical protein
MIVYLANKARFRDDILTNRIEEIVHEAFRSKLGKSVGESELSSWKHSLREMDRILEDAEIPANAGVAIEFNIPQTSKRVDFIRAAMRRTGVHAGRCGIRLPGRWNSEGRITTRWKPRCR